VKAYRGDAKTLLAFNLPKAKAKNLAGFTVQISPLAQPPYYLQNNLRFADPSKHAQDAKLPPNSSFNAPIHKFRWSMCRARYNRVRIPSMAPTLTRLLHGILMRRAQCNPSIQS
jgi:hypothetical protein